jgi:hypothetical protein
MTETFDHQPLDERLHGCGNEVSGFPYLRGGQAVIGNVRSAG